MTVVFQFLIIRENGCCSGLIIAFKAHGPHKKESPLGISAEGVKHVNS